MEKINLSEEYFVKNILPICKKKYNIAILVDVNNKKLVKLLNDILANYTKKSRGVFVNKGIIVIFDVNTFDINKYKEYFDYFYEFYYE